MLTITIKPVMRLPMIDGTLRKNLVRIVESDDATNNVKRITEQTYPIEQYSQREAVEIELLNFERDTYTGEHYDP